MIYNELVYEMCGQLTKKTIMKTIEKNSIWICLMLAMAITWFIGSYIINAVEEITKGEDLSGLAFGIVWILSAIFFGVWAGLGWLLDKILP
jgi:hypothetical protein